MRQIRLPRDVVERALAADPPGLHAVIPVVVDWPELRLTEQQILENAVAHAAGEPAPHIDPRYIDIVIER